MYTIFQWILTILSTQWIRIFRQIHTICTSNEHNFPLNFHDFVLSTKSNSQQVRTICRSYVHNFPLNFHDLVRSLIFHRIFTNLPIQRIRIFLQIRIICISNIQNFLMNFHDFVVSKKTNLSTSLDYLYI